MTNSKVLSKRLEQVEALRGLAFLGVFLSHTGIICFGAAGHWGVSIFLVISGFMMMYSYYGRILQSNLWENINFSAHKIRRLYPLYIVTMLFMTAFWFTGGGKEYISIDILKFILNILVIQEWFPIKNVSINGVSWYLVTAAFCYFIFPKVLHILENIKDSKYIFRMLLALLLIQVILDKTISYLPKLCLFSDLFLSDISEWLIYFYPLTRSLDFIMGCCTGYLYLTNFHEKQFNNLYLNRLFNIFSNRWILLFSVVMANIICAYFEHYVLILNGEATGGDIWWTYSIPFTFSSCALIYCVVSKPTDYKKIIVNRVTLFFGKISSSAFLIHYVVFQYIKSFLCHFVSRGFYNEYGSLVKLTIGFIITIIATLIWEKVELKIINSRN